MKYLIEELGFDVNARDSNGYTAMHNAAARGDNEMILWLVAHGGDVNVVSRKGQTTVDMANGPVQRIPPSSRRSRCSRSSGPRTAISARAVDRSDFLPLISTFYHLFSVPLSKTHPRFLPAGSMPAAFANSFWIRATRSTCPFAGKRS